MFCVGFLRGDNVKHLAAVLKRATIKRRGVDAVHRGPEDEQYGDISSVGECVCV